MQDFASKFATVTAVMDYRPAPSDFTRVVIKPLVELDFT